MRGKQVVLHLGGIVGITAAIVFATFYPFLPGRCDGLAVAMSMMAQVFGLVALLLVPVGGVWLAHELRNRARRKRGLPVRPRGNYSAVASVAVCSIIAVLLSLAASLSVGFSLGFLVLVLWAYVVFRYVPKLKPSQDPRAANFSRAPLCFVAVPIAVVAFQALLAGPASRFCRDYAIARSAELIQDIEKYHAAQGRYPSSLAAVWKDYHPSVVGIERFEYAPNGDAYNLFFEQPELLIHNFGTREFVVFNKLDQHLIPSHAGWILAWAPEELIARQGWYAQHDASAPHWKYFWFD
jgi:hypothetical protein